VEANPDHPEVEPAPVGWAFLALVGTGKLRGRVIGPGRDGGGGWGHANGLSCRGTCRGKSPRLAGGC